MPLRHPHIRSIRAATLAALAFFAACKSKSNDVIVDTAGGDIALTWSPAGVSSVMNVPGAAITSAITSEVAGPPKAPLTKDTWSHVQGLYKAYNNVPLWLTGDGFDKPRAAALMSALADAPSDGLRLDQYPLMQIGAAIDTVNNTKTPSAATLANLDVMLTAAYVALGQDLMIGQVDPKTVNQSWHISSKEEKVDSALNRSLRAEQLDRAIALMRPRDETYDSLRTQLARYREAAAKGFTHVPEGKTLKAGQSDSPARIGAVIARLGEEGYQMGVQPGPAVPDSTKPSSPTDTTPRTAVPQSGVYTKAIAQAVSNFQSHHGMTVTGTLNPETVDAMNVSPQYRAAQIAANLERDRWMPRSLGTRYIVVNVPAFKVTAYDSGRQVLQMKVIVGQEYEGKATPVFADSMQYVVFRPYWNVTPDIQAKEFANKDAATLAAQGFEYYQDAGVTRIRQKPGPKNALGLVKFLFPNDFNIYLHDTPNDELFKKDVRAFSHGCIRLEKPDEMAQYVLGWDLDRIHAAMNEGGDNKTVTLKQPIPVYITYLTTYINDGQLYFGNDLYKRDDDLVNQVAPGAIPPADQERAARTLRKIADEWGGKD